MLLHKSEPPVVLISPEDKDIIDNFQNLGIKTIFTNKISELISYEQSHADMQLLKIVCVVGLKLH